MVRYPARLIPEGFWWLLKASGCVPLAKGIFKPLGCPDHMNDDVEQQDAAWFSDVRDLCVWNVQLVCCVVVLN